MVCVILMYALVVYQSSSLVHHLSFRICGPFLGRQLFEQKDLLGTLDGVFLGGNA